MRALPLFAAMSEANFAALLKAAFLQRFPPHTTLITEGELPDFLHIVVDGSVEMFSAHNGRETTIEIMRPVTAFILAAVIRDEVDLQSARNAQGDRRTIELEFDKRTLASLLGMTPENLSRNLAVLTRHGVKGSGRDIVVEDESALMQFAKPNVLIDG